MKKLHTLLLLSGFAFLAYLIWKIGARELWKEVTSLGWGLTLFIGLEFIAEAIHTIAWSYCLNQSYRKLSWFQRFRIRMAGYAITYLTPTAALGGTVTQAALLSSNHEGPEAVSGVLIARLCSGLSHLLFVAAGSIVILCCATLPGTIWAAMFSGGGLVAAGIILFLLLQKYGKLGVLVRWLAASRFSGKALQNVVQKITSVDEALKTFYRERPRDLVLAVCWDLFAHSTGFLQTAWFFYLLHQPIAMRTIAVVWILGMWFDLIMFAVPLNMGTLEGSRIVIFKAIGLGAVSGMTYGIALRLAQLSCACFGIVNYALFSTVWRTPKQMPPCPMPGNSNGYLHPGTTGQSDRANHSNAIGTPNNHALWPDKDPEKRHIPTV